MAKSAQAFRTISEAADEIGVAQHVLRFWETKFTFIRPMKRAGGRRFYRPADIVMLSTIRRLLHDEGHSISEVQALHRDRALKLRVAAPAARKEETKASPNTERASSGPEAPTASPSGLNEALKALEAAKMRLDAILSGIRPAPSPV